ncbi:hypothetical protein HPB50_003613 [Hyalomma asiaticum]|uniref:Uncharacterized protein n=1 Tax=Hyalomma asiaticum TaxID=266040 RepID=A0ACB7RHE0_HYAAI|nr:hypothetical protein HPB50_003613 [Hyalomma asiaticum]
MNGDHYEKWFSQKLLPLLPPGSVIVMDNAPYHSVKQEKVPRMSSLKKDIQAWLSERRCSVEQRHGEGGARVDNVHASGDRYRVDCIAEASGHLVVRLPHYPCQLNPIELAWSEGLRSSGKQNV